MKTRLLLSAFLLCSVLISYGQWTYTNLSGPKELLGSAAIGNKVFFAGGYNGTQYLSEVEVYDVTTGVWGVAGSLSVPREFPGGSVTCGSKIFFAGGFNWVTSFNTVDVYDTLTKQWSVLSLSDDRFSLAAISHGSKVMFAGGVDYPALVYKSVVDIYDTQTGVWTTSFLSIPREGIAAAVAGDYAIFAGGLADNGATNRVDIYNFTTNTWSQASLSQARGMASATTLGSKIFIAGGITSLNSPTNRVDIFDVSTGTWTVASLSFPRAAHNNAATVCGKAYFVGGGKFMGSGYNTPSGVIDIYDPTSNTWSVMNLQSPRVEHAVNGVGDYLVVAGGKNNSGKLSSVEIYYNPTLIHVPADFPTIQQGINAATTGDTVLVAEGTYYEQISFIGKKPLTVASQFLLDGDTSHISKTIIDGSHLTNMDSASVVYFISGEDTTSILCGFTIQHGKGTVTPDEFGDWDGRQGGGIWIAGAGAKIIHNRITNNTLNDTQDPVVTNVNGAGIGTPYEDADYWIVLEGNTIKNNTCTSNHYQAGGAGISTSYSTRLINNLISNNTCTGLLDASALGGGVSLGGEFWTNPLRLVAENNKITHNICQAAGMANSAGVLVQVAKVIFTGNEIAENSVTDGAGIDFSGGGGMFLLNVQAGSIISHNIFTGNSSNDWSGGIHLKNFEEAYDTVLIENNFFIDNEAKRAGAIGTIEVPVKLQNNVFSGNHAETHGGAVVLWKNELSPVGHFGILINNSFSGNSAVFGSGAILSMHAKPFIMNSVFWGDTAGSGGNEIGLAFYTDTVELVNTTILPASIDGNFIDGGGNHSEDPMFLDPVLLTLSPSSTCIDAGTKAYTCHCGMQLFSPGYDILGLPRPWGSSYTDMGAYEFTDFTGIDDFGFTISDFGLRIYPNPITNSTTVTYTLKESSQVNLLVFDSYGRFVEELVNSYQQIGTRKFEWNAGSQPAGIYYCRLQAGNQAEAEKIIILK